MGHDQEQPRLRTLGGELRGEVVAIDQAETGLEVIIRLDDGTHLHVPTNDPVDALGGTFYLPVTLAPPEMTMTQVRSRTRADVTAAHDEDASTREDVLPVVKEELKVGKRAVETDTVRVSTRAHEREEEVDLPLRRDEVDIERVPVNKVVDAWVPVRTEGDVTIIPVLEETMVGGKTADAQGRGARAPEDSRSTPGGTRSAPRRGRGRGTHTRRKGTNRQQATSQNEVNPSNSSLLNRNGGSEP